ncbi:unnamed protein product [Lota lota]
MDVEGAVSAKSWINMVLLKCSLGVPDCTCRTGFARLQNEWHRFLMIGCQETFNCDRRLSWHEDTRNPLDPVRGRSIDPLTAAPSTTKPSHLAGLNASFSTVDVSSVYLPSSIHANRGCGGVPGCVSRACSMAEIRGGC